MHHKQQRSLRSGQSVTGRASGIHKVSCPVTRACLERRTKEQKEVKSAILTLGLASLLFVKSSEHVRHVTRGRSSLHIGEMYVLSRSTALAWVTLFLVPFAATQTTCSKFAGQASKVVTVGNTCYYGFSSNEYWDAAQTRCELQGTHLVHLQTITKQKDVYAALGSDFTQHWMGLVYLNSEWKWYTNTQNTVSAMNDVDTRWEGGSSGESAYTTSSSNQWVLKATQRTSWYRAVCEDGTSSIGSQTDVSPSTYLTTVPSQPSSATVAATQTTCSKFAGQASKVVTVGNTCYYGFSSNEYWDAAQTRCELQGTHLVHLQTITKQKDVYAALGPDFTQHWMGLVYLNNEWEWYTNTQNTVSAMNDVDTRWEGGSSGESAYTTSSSNQWVLKATPRTSWYRAVCEDGTSSVDSTTAIVVSTATQSSTLSTTVGSTVSTSTQKSTVTTSVSSASSSSTQTSTVSTTGTTLSTTVGSTVSTSTQKSTVTTSVSSASSSSTQTSTISTTGTSLQSSNTGSKTTSLAASTLESHSSSVDSSPSTIGSTASTQKLTTSVVDSKVSTTNSFKNSLDSFVLQTPSASTSDSTFFTLNTTASSVNSARSTLNSSASAADSNTSTAVTTTMTTKSSTNPRGSRSDTYLDTWLRLSLHVLHTEVTWHSRIVHGIFVTSDTDGQPVHSFSLSVSLVYKMIR